MKKLAIVLFLFLFSTQSFSQIEDYIKTAVSSLEREVVSVDNLYLQGQFVKIVQSQSYEELLKAYHEKDFS
jgi:cell shape-determining protein MreC